MFDVQFTYSQGALCYQDTNSLWKPDLTKKGNNQAEMTRLILVDKVVTSDNVNVTSAHARGFTNEVATNWRVFFHLHPLCSSSSAVSLVDYITLSIHFTIARSPPLSVYYLLEDKCSEDDSQDDSVSGTVPESGTHFQAKLPRSPSRETWSNLGPVMPSHGTRCPFTPTSFAFFGNLFSLSPM